ncbi:unnamed protein product [Heligmosomoides polygyrus]|uniref:Uncharacterized protein n=1 Tax=Heligmosomoides polygyrus TaxID=6339 RepID=A0A183GBC0_HELPZ|nr:unnamed protein product [Heligmosomoides polygyrus]
MAATSLITEGQPCKIVRKVVSNFEGSAQLYHLSLISELLERAPATSPFVPVAYQSAPMDIPRSRDAKSVISFTQGFHEGVQPTRWWGSWCSLDITRNPVDDGCCPAVFAKCITWPAHLIFDDGHASVTCVSRVASRIVLTNLRCATLIACSSCFRMGQVSLAYVEEKQSGAE